MVAHEQGEFAEIFVRADQLVGQVAREFQQDASGLDHEHAAAEFSAPEHGPASVQFDALAGTGEQFPLAL